MTEMIGFVQITLEAVAGFLLMPPICYLFGLVLGCFAIKCFKLILNI